MTYSSELLLTIEDNRESLSTNTKVSLSQTFTSAGFFQQKSAGLPNLRIIVLSWKRVLALILWVNTSASCSISLVTSTWTFKD